MCVIARKRQTHKYSGQVNVCQAQWGGGNEGNCLLGAGISLGVKNIFWNKIVVWLHNIVDILYATDLYTKNA